MIQKDYNFLIYLFLITINFSCEDPINIELEPENSRLIVQALIKVDINKEFTDSQILFTTTADFFFQDRLEQASVENVVLENISTGEVVYYEGVTFNSSGIQLPISSNGTQIQDSRIATSFFTHPNATFKLSFSHQNKYYEALSTFAPSSPINFEQTTIVSPLERELTVRFQDIPNEENYYILEFDGRNYFPVSDQFFEDNEAIITINRNLDDSNDSSTEAVRNIGADVNLFNYFNSLLDQSDQEGPFEQLPSVTVRGNIYSIINNNPTTDPNDFVLGYFSISQIYRAEVEIE